MPTPTKSAEVIELLCRYEVDFIVVGMTAGVLQGAPAVTFDLDIVYARDSGNIARLLSALHELEAVFRADDRRLVPNESHLRSPGHKLLMTNLGVVDVLGALGELEYEDLVPDSIVLPLDDLKVRVLSLERLIEVKERAGRAKDLAVLPLLRSTLARARNKPSR